MQKHKVLAFLLALVVSIALWFYAVTVVNPNDTAKISDIKVRIVGTGELASYKIFISWCLVILLMVFLSCRV